MANRLKQTFLAAVAIVATGGALAEPRNYALPEPIAELRAPKDPAHASGLEATEANCKSCHSVDYIAMQPPGKGQAFWESEVTKMVKAYKAPIDEADGKKIAAYLADAY